MKLDNTTQKRMRGWHLSVSGWCVNFQSFSHCLWVSCIYLFKDIRLESAVKRIIAEKNTRASDSVVVSGLQKRRSRHEERRHIICRDIIICRSRLTHTCGGWFIIRFDGQSLQTGAASSYSRSEELLPGAFVPASAGSRRRGNP